MSNLHDYQKAVVVVMDEMHIREGLVYDKHSGALVGFTDVNNLLANFDHSLSEEPHAPRLSKTMLVFMVRGLFTKLFNSPMPNLLLRQYLVIKSPPFSGNVT